MHGKSLPHSFCSINIHLLPSTLLGDLSVTLENCPLVALLYRKGLFGVKSPAICAQDTGFTALLRGRALARKTVHSLGAAGWAMSLARVEPCIPVELGLPCPHLEFSPGF